MILQVFAFSNESKSLVVLFKSGVEPPSPEKLKRSLGAKARSLED